MLITCVFCVPITRNRVTKGTKSNSLLNDRKVHWDLDKAVSILSVTKWKFLPRPIHCANLNVFLVTVKAPAFNPNVQSLSFVCMLTRNCPFLHNHRYMLLSWIVWQIFWNANAILYLYRLFSSQNAFKNIFLALTPQMLKVKLLCLYYRKESR